MEKLPSLRLMGLLLNSGGSAEKIAEASPTSEADKLKARIKELESLLSSYKDSKLTDADIPF